MSIKVNRVEETKPPTTTVAKGLWTSEPTPFESKVFKNVGHTVHMEKKTTTQRNCV